MKRAPSCPGVSTSQAVLSSIGGNIAPDEHEKDYPSILAHIIPGRCENVQRAHRDFHLLELTGQKKQNNKGRD
ncbi:hypothetical protein MJO28_012046 [Puccinia striiformis f. sp. tritici]|uniref:Uncharacterized protein n=1 Tax=Puccinia striiformis f. sp. tritici TaxID=168172 RepID=A0ACC0E0C6_9BASI|nr:hypothetical protein MJO28_012046 [Puccinia striiformis f. sp. tritici]KAI7946065.1 hypothetical protein MJO29_012453 [Puccinia striiformis f. sp. tritici]